MKQKILTQYGLKSSHRQTSPVSNHLDLKLVGHLWEIQLYEKICYNTCFSLIFNLYLSPIYTTPGAYASNFCYV